MATKAGITWEEFLAAGKEGQRWEYVDGEVVFMTPVFRPHGKINVQLDYELVAFTRKHPEWVAYGTDTAFTMASGNWRCPDAALVRKERVDAADPQDQPPSLPTSLSRFSRPATPEAKCKASAVTIPRARSFRCGWTRSERPPRSSRPTGPPSIFATVKS